MKVVHRILTALSLGGCLLSAYSGTGFALGARDALGLPLDKVYEQMLTAAGAGNFARVKSALDLVKPISREIAETVQATPDVDIQKTIEMGDKAKVEAAVRSYVAYGIESLLSQSRRADPGQASNAVKAGYREYLTIDKSVQKIDFPLSNTINNGFRKANAVAGTGSFAAGCQELEQKLKTLARK